MYDMRNHYWLADDGRLFKSKTETVVTTSDPDFVTWNENFVPTSWPRDNAGNQTDAALQEVLAPYGLFVNDEYFAKNELNESINGGYITTGLASAPNGMPTMSAQYNRTEVNIAAIRAMEDNQYSTTWVGADDNFYPVTNAEIKAALAIGLSDHMEACYSAYTNASTQIKAKKIDRNGVRVLFSKFIRGKWPT